MKIAYDAEAKALYIHLIDSLVGVAGIVDISQELSDNVIIDRMKDGILYGIEILNVETQPLIEDEE